MTGLKILAVDSHDLYWRRSCTTLEADPRFEMVYVVDSVDQALNCIAAVDPDVVMLDITLPGSATLDLASRMQETPGRAVLMAAAEAVDDASLSLAISLGAKACVPRDTSPGRLANVITEVAEGKLPLEREVACRPMLLSSLLTEFQRHLRPAFSEFTSTSECPLTNRELGILTLVADGEANKEVAVNLEIAERTVKNHMANILEKLAARSRAHAVRLAVENKWICQPEQAQSQDEVEMLELAA